MVAEKKGGDLKAFFGVLGVAAVIVAGALASLNDISRNLSKNTSNVTEPTGNLSGAFDPI